MYQNCCKKCGSTSLHTEVNELGYETRVGRNMYTGNLSIAVIRDPNVKGE